MKSFLVCSVLAVFILHASVFVPWEKYLFPFSPQAEVDPQTIAESYNPYETEAIFDGVPVDVPELASNPISETSVLGDTTEGKRIEIDLTNQKLYAFEGNNKVFDFLVSTGKWGRTPTGVFNVWIKLRATKMEGGSKALRTYYYLPNVPYTMYFYNSAIPKIRGYGIHGTYWHNNFGHPMSHGCINMRTEEAGQLYNWAYVGIPVIISGVAPAS